MSEGGTVGGSVCVCLHVHHASSREGVWSAIIKISGSEANITPLPHFIQHGEFPSRPSYVMAVWIPFGEGDLITIFFPKLKSERGRFVPTQLVTSKESLRPTRLVL